MAEKVAIIGAGWAGLQMLQSLKEIGVEAEIFESRSTVGGTWNPKMSYHGLQVHSPMYTNTMIYKGEAFPFKGMSPESLMEKLDAKAVHEYLQDYAEKLGLKEMIHFNTRVKEVRYHSKSRLAHVLVAGAEGDVEKGPYRLVVFSSFATKGAMPSIPQEGFKGQVIHSCEFKEEVMAEILEKGSKVVVLGGGKSGCDMICAFQKKNFKELTWLFRSPYWFVKYETLAHRVSVAGFLRGLAFIFSLLLFLVSESLGLFLGWLIGYLVLPKSQGARPSHWDAKRFHFGLLDEAQRGFIAEVPSRLGEPQKLTEKGVVLKDGAVVPCDILICATGYETGFKELTLVKDGKVMRCDVSLYQHAIVPNFPCLLVAPLAFYNFGPIRALTTAQYISHYLEAKPSEEQMCASAKQNWASQTPEKFNGFRSDLAFVPEFLLFYLDLWRGGLVSIISVLRIFFDLFALCRMSPLRLSVGKMPAYHV